MKITAIKQYYWGRYHFLKVETDEEIYGVGEATLRVKQPTITEAVKLLERRLIGEDVFQLEWNFYKYFCYDRWRNGVVMNTALAAIEVAILDAIGKKLNEPVCNLFGGALRKKVPLYANGWANADETPEEVKELAEKYRSLGFKAFKGNPVPWASFDSPYRNITSRADVDKGIERVWLWREVLGDDVEITIDLHGRLDYDLALRFLQGVEGAKPYFVEEPLMPDDICGYRKLHQNSSVPLAAGERSYTRWGHRPFLEERILRVIQPDFAHCGGLCEAKKMAANAELFGVQIAPHNSNSSMSALAAIHIDATIPNFYKQEFHMINMEIDQTLNKTPMKIVDGCVSLENAQPGIGFIPDFDALLEQPLSDNNLNDW